MAWEKVRRVAAGLCLIVAFGQGLAYAGATKSGVIESPIANAHIAVGTKGFSYGQVKRDLETDKVLKGWTQALGGPERLRRIENLYLRGTVETRGLSGYFEEWRVATGQHKQNIDLGGAYKQLTVFNGSKGWVVDQNGSVQQLSGSDLENEVTSAYLGSFSHLIPGRMPGKGEYVGEDESKQSHILRILPTGGQAITFYISKTTYIPLKMERPEAGRIRTTYLSDWREVNGIKIPFHLRQSVGDPSFDILLSLEEARFNVPLIATTFEQPQEGSSDFRFVSGQRALGIPFELLNSNHIFLQAKVNGSGPYWFILDSGAATSIINERLANSLNLRIQAKIEGRTSGDSSFDIGFVKGISFNLPGLDLTNQTIGTAHLEPLEPLVGRTIDGLLGYDFISRFVVEVDYAAKTLNLYDPKAYQYSGSGETIPITLDGNLPYLRGRLAVPGRDLVEGKFLVDTGTSYFLELNKAFVERHKFLDATQKTIQPSPINSHEQGERRMGRVKNLQLGRFTIQNPVVGFSLTTHGVQADPNQDGIVGGDLLRRFKVILDYSRGKMILEPNSYFAEPIEYDMSGADIIAEGADFKTFRVREVFADSPAAEAGLRNGDIIIAMDGRLATEFTLDQINGMFNQAGSEYVLTIKRGNNRLRLNLKLRRLI